MKKILFIIFITVLLNSCKKEFSDSFTPYTSMGINDTVWTNKPLTGSFIDSVSASLNNSIWFIDSFNIASEKKYKLNDSLELSFPAHYYVFPNTNSPGLIPDGNIKVEFLTLQKKGDYIKALIPVSSNNYLLEPTGSFFVRLSRNGQKVVMAPNYGFNIKWRDDYPKTNMKFFEGFSTPNRDSLFTWLPAAMDGYISVWDSTSSGVNKKGYQMTSKNTDWISSCYFLDTTKTTRLNVTLPLNFTNKNSFVFAVVNDKKTVVRLTTDFSTRSFYCLNVPVNTSVTLLSISLIDNTYYLGTRTVTVNNADRFTLTPAKSTPINIISVLDNL